MLTIAGIAETELSSESRVKVIWRNGEPHLFYSIRVAIPNHTTEAIEGFIDVPLRLRKHFTQIV